jgi:DNA-binding transcriptional LysR family regulator
MPSIRTLRTFLAVARGGSFAAAGKAIGLTAAAVGQQVRALDEELHLTLFDRSDWAIVLNSSGRSKVAPVLELVQRFEAQTRWR